MSLMPDIRPALATYDFPDLIYYLDNTPAGPKTTVDLAHEEQIPVGLAQEMVAEVEAAGDICRDDGGGRVGLFGAMAESRWWVNTFVAYVWDGQED